MHAPGTSSLRLVCASTALLLCASIASATSVNCHVRTSPATPADLAMSHGDYPQAESLYAAELQSATPASPEAGRLHAALIRAQLRQSKLADAEKDALAWSSNQPTAAHTAQPADAWPLVALAEVQWREGKVNETLQTLGTARHTDFCNPQVHADLATIFRMSAQYASANSELTLARKLDPIDEHIYRDWLRLQPRAVQLAELTRYLDSAPSLSDNDRKALERRKQRLSEPAASGCHLVTPVASTSIPLRYTQDTVHSPVYWGLDVVFNGKHRALELDTGASGLVLTKSAANALHLTPDFHFKSSGVGDEGDVDSFVAKVASIKIGSLEFQDCDVQVLGKNPEGMHGEDGLIGGDVFSSFLFTVDFPGHTVKLDPLPKRPTETADAQPSLDTGVSTEPDLPQDAYHDPSMQDWDRVFRSGHNLIVPVELKPQGPWKLFILDTGSGLDLISPDAAREVGKVSNGSWINITGISGEVKKTWTTGPMTLYFSHIAAPNNGMLSIDTARMGKATGVEISGFIGAPTLHQLIISIDYRDNLVHFQYDPKRIRRCIDQRDIADCY